MIELDPSLCAALGRLQCGEFGLPAVYLRREDGNREGRQRGAP